MAAGKEIKRLRLKAEASADKVAGLIGVSAGALRKWEERDTDPSDSGDIRKVERYFGVSLAGLPAIQNFDFVKKDLTDDYKEKYLALLEEHKELMKQLFNLPALEDRLLGLESRVDANVAYFAKTVAQAQKKDQEAILFELGKIAGDLKKSREKKGKQSDGNSAHR